MHVLNISVYKNVQAGLMTFFWCSLKPPRNFFSTSAHFITHPLSMPQLFQPSCLYQHDTSLGLVSSPSCSESGQHSRNPKHKHPLLHGQCAYVSQREKQAFQTECHPKHSSMTRMLVATSQKLNIKTLPA